MLRPLPILLAVIVLSLGAAAQSATPAAAAVAPPASPRVTYTFQFKNSSPSFFTVTIARDGAASVAIRQSEGDSLDHLAFVATAPTVAEVFKDAGALHDFAGDRLQSHDQVAFTGARTLTYDDAAGHHSQSFTFTTNRSADGLDHLMQRIGNTASMVEQLRQDLRYNRLDVLQVMEQITRAWQNGALAEPQLLEPLLRRAASSGDVMTAAQHRAQALLAAMHKPPKR